MPRRHTRQTLGAHRPPRYPDQLRYRQPQRTMKHSAGIAIATGEFVFNLCTRPLFEAMNISSGALASGESEFEAAGLATAPSRIAKVSPSSSWSHEAWVPSSSGTYRCSSIASGW